MNPAAPHHEGILSKHRLEGLSDGVFAVVLTLLVLELKPEHLPPHASNAEVWAAIRELARPLFGYALTFALAGMFWMLQHRKFLLISHSTPRHTWLTLIFLFWVSLLPFTVSLWVRTMNQSAGLTLYYANMALIAASLLIGWLEACRSGLATDASNEARTRLTFRIAAMTAGCFAAAFITCFYAPLASVALLLIVIGARVLWRKFTPAPASP